MTIGKYQFFGKPTALSRVFEINQTYNTVNLDVHGFWFFWIAENLLMFFIHQVSEKLNMSHI
jgi:hypothetical protein